VRIFSHFSADTLSNVYLVGFPSGDAFLVDPSVFDAELLTLIEHNRYTINCVMLTHNDEAHLAGLRAILRIYPETRIYSALPRVMDVSAHLVTDGEKIDVCRSSAQVIAIPGHGRDRVAYFVGGFLFTGSALSAGEPGQVSNPYAKAILLANIADAFFSLPDATVVLPFYGPPTTVGVERASFPMEDPLELAGLS
jgi:glyoxylase-like metal-dependent hydrolase (beta-lactamase superfamily II)